MEGKAFWPGMQGTWEIYLTSLGPFFLLFISDILGLELLHRVPWFCGDVSKKMIVHDL